MTYFCRFRVNIPGIRHSDILLTDTVGFISKLPINLVAAFRATLEEIVEADVLLVSELYIIVIMLRHYFLSA